MASRSRVELSLRLLLWLLVFVSWGECFLFPSFSPDPYSRASVHSLYSQTFIEVGANYAQSSLQVSSTGGWVPIFTVTSNADAINAMANGTIDFAVISIPVPSTTISLHPDIGRYPLMLLPIVVAYNPGTLGCVFNATCAPVVLTRTALCAIFKGNISSWQDPQLSLLNVNANLPQGPITVVVTSDADEGATLALVQLCTKVNPAWSSIGSNANWNASTAWLSVVNASATNAADRAAVVLTTPGAVTYMFQSQAISMGLPFASLVNKAGITVAPNSTSVAAAAWETLANTLLVNASAIDLTDASNARAYPLMSPGYVLLPLRYARVSCTLRLRTLSFIRYLLGSTAAAATALNQNVQLLDTASQTVTNITGQLTGDFICDGSYVLAPAQTAGKVFGSALANKALTYLLAHYQDINSLYSFTYVPLSSAKALVQLSQFNALLSNVTTDAVVASAADWPTVNGSWSATVAQALNLSVIPALLTGVVPIFHLPTAVANTSIDPSYKLMAPLYPLVLSVDVLAAIFLGQITSWLDPAVVQMNPSLPARFLHTASPTKLSAIVCCSSSADPLAATNSLASSLWDLSPRWRAAFGLRPVPMSWGVVVNGVLQANTFSTATNISVNATSNLTIITAEKMVSAVVSATGGSVGYVRVTTRLQDDTRQFRVVRTSFDATVSSPVLPAARPSSMDHCVTSASFNPTAATLDLTKTTDPMCWPLTQLLSFVLPASYSRVSIYGLASSLQTDRCTRGSVAVPMIQAFTVQSGPSLNATINNGYWPLLISSGASEALALGNNTLNSISCDGASILTISTSQWTLSPTIHSVGLALIALLMIVCVLTLVVLAGYRQQPVFRSSSGVFLGVIVLGFLLILSSAALSLSKATESSCTSFLWCLVLGFTLTFAPLFLKVWRIYRIFERKQLTVVRVADRLLLIGIGAMLLVDLIILAVWQVRAPIQAQLLTGPVTNNSAVQYMECVIPSPSLPYLALQCGYKGLLLLFGGLMAFSTRHVTSQFNESQIVGWSIYNVLLTAAVVVAVVLTDVAEGNGKALILLVALLWVPTWTWICLFPSKLQVLYYILAHPRHTEAMMMLAVKGRNPTITASSQGNSEASAEKNEQLLPPAMLAALDDKALLAYVAMLRIHVTRANNILRLRQDKVRQQPDMFEESDIR